MEVFSYDDYSMITDDIRGGFAKLIAMRIGVFWLFMIWLSE